MISWFLRDVSALEDTEDATSMRLLLLAQGVEAQKVQKEALDSLKEAKDFDSVRCSTHKHDNEAHRKQK